MPTGRVEECQDSIKPSVKEEARMKEIYEQAKQEGWETMIMGGA